MFIHLIYKKFVVVLLKLMNKFSITDHGTLFHFRLVVTPTGLKK